MDSCGNLGYGWEIWKNLNRRCFSKKKKTARIWAEGGGHEDVKVVAKGDFKAGAWKGWEGWCHRQQMV